MDVLKELLLKTFISRKAVATIVAVLLNMLGVVFLRFGVELDDATTGAIREGLELITGAIMVFVAAQSGVDVAKEVWGQKNVGTFNGVGSGMVGTGGDRVGVSGGPFEVQGNAVEGRGVQSADETGRVGAPR